MVIMALDHVRDFFYKVNLEKAGSAATGPTNLETTYPLLFLPAGSPISVPPYLFFLPELPSI